jgi:hypothetical protein
MVCMRAWRRPGHRPPRRAVDAPLIESDCFRASNSSLTFVATCRNALGKPRLNSNLPECGEPDLRRDENRLGRHSSAAGSTCRTGIQRTRLGSPPVRRQHARLVRHHRRAHSRHELLLVQKVVVFRRKDRDYAWSLTSGPRSDRGFRRGVPSKELRDQEGRGTVPQRRARDRGVVTSHLQERLLALMVLSWTSEARSVSS